MPGLLVSDLMNWPVISADPVTPAGELATLLRRYRLAAVPVADTRARPVGVVAASDLPVRSRRRRGGKRGPVARELMARPVPTVNPDEPVAGAARRLLEGRLPRLYVVDGAGRLIGVLARSDVLRAIVRPDAEIKAMVERETGAQPAPVGLGAVSVRVDDGVVTLEGTAARAVDVERAGRLAEAVPGVVAVRNRVRRAVAP
ncbi:CBS domain-containing protein [Amycolatopsis lexingtonensis]|uniref:CBS domain-containing protein n=1 Tax=Amycolatopsis lexingtonensis TaxID=218822 RepID=A0ABR9HSV8_9PSEU|nr:CBS domain-containing protein [Amycolatopsis lexingtonensis]MBE1494008.1 CBS domain-containing protein [Amycolatopsis lexingtonensis]